MKKQRATGSHPPAEDHPGDADTIPNLSLEDTSTQMMRGVHPSKTGSHAGCNPYDTFPNTSSPGGNSSTRELRRLSDWIRQKRQAEKLKAEQAGQEDHKDDSPDEF